MLPGYQTDFVLGEALERCWTDYTEGNEEKFFRKFVAGFVHAWHLQVSPNWELLVTAYLQNGRHSERTIVRLPDELLPALSKFLFVAKDEAEQSSVNVNMVTQMKEIVQCLSIVCRNPEHIPLVASMDFVRQLTQLSTLLLQHLLEMESTFFVSKVRTEVTSQNLRTEIMAFIAEACHFLETLYDPYFQWRAYVCGKDDVRSPGGSLALESTPTLLHPETIPFLYESFETALVECFPGLGLDMLNVYGAILSGSRRNALKAISPATTKMLLKTVRDANTSQELHVGAIYCSAKSIQVLHDAPLHERQLEVSIVVQQYIQILTSLREKAGLVTLIEAVGILTRILKVKNTQDLKKILAKNDLIDTLMTLLETCNLDVGGKRTLLPVVVNRISLLLSECDLSCDQMTKNKGYDRLFGIINGLGPPDMNTLISVLSMSTLADDSFVSDKKESPGKLLRNTKPISYLLKWISETEYENDDQQVWLTESLRKLCSANVHNRMLCCQSDILVQIMETLKSFERLNERSVAELFGLLEILGSHSISPVELKQLLALLQDQEDVEVQFPYRSQVIDVINFMAKGSGRHVCRDYFDIRPGSESGLSVPNIRQWAVPIHGFSFHCWMRLDRSGNNSSPKRVANNGDTSAIMAPPGDSRRQLYSIYTSSGNGFEAFVTEDGTLTVATASKKEFLAVPLTEVSTPIDDGHWHCIQICHSAGKRPFGSSQLQVYIDGTKKIDCTLKYPITTGDAWAYCQIGSPLRRTAVPALNVDTSSSSKPQRIKDGIMDAIKIGVPGVLNLPQSLRHGSSNPHVRWTLIGLEDQLWGKAASIGGQLGMICVFQDSLSSSLVKMLYDLGPNQYLNIATDENPENLDLVNKVVFSFAASACRNMICPNLNSTLPQFEGHVMAEPFCTQDIKDSISCVGGVHALIPLLERGSLAKQSFYISGFLTLIRNFVWNHPINSEQLMRGGGVYIIGGLMQSLDPILVDVNVLMGAQVLAEMAQESKDPKLLLQIYNSILFDFRIWSKSEFFVQIGHIQYLSTLIKEERKYFRKKFGVQFILDVIRVHYSNCPAALSKEDCKTIRSSLFGLIKFYLHKDVTSKDVIPIVNFILTVKQEELLQELVDLLIAYLESRHVSDQMFLIMYESKRADLFSCLLVDNSFTEAFRHNLIRLLLVLLRTHRVSTRHKLRMHLKEARYLGLFHLRCKNIEAPLTLAESNGFLDMMFMFDDDATYQGALGLAHHLQWVGVEVKLAYVRRLTAAIFAKPEAPSQFAKKIGWQDCLARLLVKRVLKPELDVSIVSIDESVLPSDNADTGATPLSPSHYLELAANTAKTYIPEPAVERIGKVVETTRRRVSDAKGMAQEKVAKTQQTANNLLGKVQDFGDKAAFRMRSATITSMSTSEHEALKYTRHEILPFTLDDFALADTKSTSTSSEDISCRGDSGRRTSSPTLTCDTDVDVPEMEMIGGEDDISTDVATMTLDEREEELCQLVINALFTIMWRGGKQPGGVTEDVIKERGQVIACINMLGLNNELYRSHVELKRHLVELCVQGVLVDMKDNPVSSHATSQAEHVMRWVYDLIVLDPHGNFGKKVSESLLDGILNLLECLVVFQEGQQDLEWLDMSKMTFDILLKCAEHTECLEICAMASAKLHALVQTRMASTKEENAYLICRLSRLLNRSMSLPSDGQHCQYAYLAPVMRALLDKSKDQLSLTVQLPSLSLRNLTGPAFVEQFRDYQMSDEWAYFTDKKLSPLRDAYLQGYLSNLGMEMDTFWAECYELSKVASHKRSREAGESKLKFLSMYLEPYHAQVKTENGRYNYMVSQQKSHLTFCMKRWRMVKRLFIGKRGAWPNHLELDDHWKLSSNENYQRMRLKLIPNPAFLPHFEASAARDNVNIAKKQSVNQQQQLLQMQISKEALQDTSVDDSLTEDDLKVIAMEQMETAQETTEADKASERLLFSEECQLVTFMSVVKGKLEATTKYVYFFDASAYRENEDRHDFRWSLSQLSELHLRRFNLRRTGVEFFLVDHTNYFLNFKTSKIRNKVYTRFIGLKLSNLVYSSGRSPSDALKSSGLTQKWVNRDISNFEYLMRLNTIAGRTFNDLSQYPVFPWILSDYNSKTLDLTNEKSYRDLSKPIGVQNPKHMTEVKAKFDQFEDPSGTVAKFHYGTHYSNSAMVLHYMVRVEPFTSLHIELQSGRFDVADRQFHSVPQTWKNLYNNVNDVKELTPEFFYFPEFLVNENNFDLGHLQGNKKSRVHDVVLPNWAKNADDFIRKHRQALESDYVDANLHHWIDLIFGYKQKGPAAVDALNVFYYCTYEGAVNLDAIKNTEEREALEGMINNFGQTPCQLLKDPHPRRMTIREWLQNRSTKGNETKKPDLLAIAPDWRPYLLNVSNEKDPLIYIQVPRQQTQSSFFGVPNTLVTISSQGLLGVHGWMPYDRSGTSDFTFEIDPTLNAINPAHGPSNASALNAKRLLPGPFAFKSNKTFVVSPDAKFVIYGGLWDHSLRALSIAKGKVVCSVVRHFGPITCLALDNSGSKHLMSGSKDTTSIIWEMIVSVGASSAVSLRPIQVLCGHDKSVSCVALSVDLDMAISGSEDGTINVYTVKEGIYLRTLIPPDPGFYFTISHLGLSAQGQIVFTGHSKDVHSIHVYSLNGRWLASGAVAHRITTLAIDDGYLLTGDENGEVVLRDLFTLERLHSLPLHLPVQAICLTSANSHALIPLRDGKLIIVGSKTR